jgi:DeoR/GlpR family transcriptional regulator of sugar metabolism
MTPVIRWDRADLGGFVAERGRATLAEVAEAFDVSEATVRRYLDGLVAQGLLSVRVGKRGPRPTPRVYYERGAR